jgi:hypothetical protein
LSLLAGGMMRANDGALNEDWTYQMPHEVLIIPLVKKSSRAVTAENRQKLWINMFLGAILIVSIIFFISGKWKSAGST